MKRENDQMLEELMEAKATEDHVAKKAVGKTQIDKNAADAMAAANAAAAAAAQGVQAYNGTFVSTGAISSSYQDHGTGRNLLPYPEVTFSNLPYGAYYYNNVSFTNDAWVTKLAGDVDDDALVFRGDLNVTSGWVPVTNPFSTHIKNVPNLFSAYFSPIFASTVDMRVRGFASKADCLAGTPDTEVFGMPGVATVSGGISRPSMIFTPTANWLRVEVRTTRTSGAAAQPTFSSAGYFYPMLESVLAGQTQPSKFSMPIPKRGDLSANLQEGGALSGYISGLGVSKSGSSTDIAIEAGACYIPGASKVVSYPGGTLTLSSTAAVRYIYLNANTDGTVTVTSSTTAPAAPYTGTAKCFPTDDRRRFIGMAVVYGSVVADFADASGLYSFQDDKMSREIVTQATNTTAVSQSLASYMPSFATLADIEVKGLWVAGTTQASSFVGTPGVHAAGTGVLSAITRNDATRQIVRGLVKTNSTPSITYSVTSSTNVNITIYMMGFYYER